MRAGRSIGNTGRNMSAMPNRKPDGGTDTASNDAAIRFRYG
jgi:hypothetical protein